MIQKPGNNESVKFIITFVVLFLFFYYFNIFYFAITLPNSSHYNAFLAAHFDYINGLRWLLIKSSASILKLFGYVVVSNKYELLVAGRGMIQVVYTCLGLGVISFFTAFVIAYPKPRKDKLIFLFAGIFCIEFLNVVRLALLALYWNRERNRVIDHHTIFNIFIYIVIAVSLYFWVTTNKNNLQRANRPV